MSERDIDGDPVDALVALRWDDYNTSLFVEKLFRHVRRDELRFDLEARSSDVETTFAIAVAPEMTVEVIEGIARYLLGRTRRAHRDLEDPHFLIVDEGADHEVVVGDDDDVREIIERTHVKVRDVDQRDLEDFSR